MDVKQRSKIEHIEETQLEMTNSWFDYWQQYSDLGTPQFWVLLGFLVIPLIILFFRMDKRKALLLGFFGYTVHVAFTYIDTFGASKALWFYPYTVLPILPVSFALDVSFVPVTYMLVYQWTLDNKKSYYLSMLVLSALLSFVFKPVLAALQLFQLHRGANYFHLFLGYFAIAIIAKAITNVFIFLKRTPSKRTPSKPTDLKHTRTASVFFILKLTMVN
ncbi:CBO0543 family protein [Bacillus songklensis]|uniref:CBO0543 family protein n=1 Tax=Bacillus songklensis TaxID=1069116 RepID=A0ABV8B9I3_9BACI